MDKYFSWLWSGGGGADPRQDGAASDKGREQIHHQHGCACCSRDRRRRRRKGQEDVEDPASAGTEPGGDHPWDLHAYHERIWKPGRLPPNVRLPRTEKINVMGHPMIQVAKRNVLVLFLGAPGTGIRSFINATRFGDKDLRVPPPPHAFYPPEYLCDGDVYSLAMARLPSKGFGAQNFEDVDHVALVLCYSAEEPEATMETLKKLQRILFGEDSVRPKRAPFPVMVLGLKKDLAVEKQRQQMQQQQLSGGDLGDASNQSQEEAEAVAAAALAVRERQRVLESWAFAWSHNMLHTEVSAHTCEGVNDALGAVVEEVDRYIRAEEDPEQTAEDMRNVWIPAIAKAAETFDDKEGGGGASGIVYGGVDNQQQAGPNNQQPGPGN